MGNLDWVSSYSTSQMEVIVNQPSQHLPSLVPIIILTYYNFIKLSNIHLVQLLFIKYFHTWY